MSKPNKQSGNVLFLILIAVALFAALSYAVTRSSRGGGNANGENTAIVASQIVQSIADVRLAFERFKLSRGLSAEEVVFCDADGSRCDTLGSFADLCSTGANCLFSPEGGGASINLPQGYALWIYDERAFSSISNVGTAADDIYLNVFGDWGVQDMPLEMCDAINKGFGQITEETIGGDWGSGLSVDGSYDFCIDTHAHPTITNYQYFSVLSAF
jgi:hypothetical protein